MSESQEKSSIEKRRHKRIDLVTDVKYTVVTPVPQSGLITNISEGGLCILLDNSLAPGTILRVEFNLPGEKQERIEALAKVAWQVAKEGKFSTGVQFVT
jgi:c-di-GMP-binding flagellar brake protein YcgR